MLCLQVHSLQDIAGYLSYTKIDGQLRRLYPPTVEGQAPAGTMRIA